MLGNYSMVKYCIDISDELAESIKSNSQINWELFLRVALESYVRRVETLDTIKNSFKLLDMIDFNQLMKSGESGSTD